MAPHIAVAVFGRGLLKRLYTRLYFADEPANADDPSLLLARPQPGEDVVTYHLDIVIQLQDLRGGGFWGGCASPKPLLYRLFQSR